MKYFLGYIIGVMSLMIAVGFLGCEFGGREFKLGNIARYDNKFIEVDNKIILLNEDVREINFYINRAVNQCVKKELSKQAREHKHRFWSGEVIKK